MTDQERIAKLEERIAAIEKEKADAADPQAALAEFFTPDAKKSAAAQDALNASVHVEMQEKGRQEVLCGIRPKEVPPLPVGGGGPGWPAPAA